MGATSEAGPRQGRQVAVGQDAHTDSSYTTLHSPHSTDSSGVHCLLFPHSGHTGGSAVTASTGGSARHTRHRYSTTRSTSLPSTQVAVHGGERTFQKAPPRRVVGGTLGEEVPRRVRLRSLQLVHQRSAALLFGCSVNSAWPWMGVGWGVAGCLDAPGPGRRQTGRRCRLALPLHWVLRCCHICWLKQRNQKH